MIELEVQFNFYVITDTVLIHKSLTMTQKFRFGIKQYNICEAEYFPI